MAAREGVKQRHTARGLCNGTWDVTEHLVLPTLREATYS